MNSKSLFCVLAKLSFKSMRVYSWRMLFNQTVVDESLTYFNHDMKSY